MGLWNADGEHRRELGSYLSEDHGNTNFISPEVARLAKLEVAYREPDALIDVDRLYRNMVSSAPATFNLFGPLALWPRLASAVFRRLCPDFVKKIDGVLFEHSPARRHPNFTMDRTAMDAVFKARTMEGQSGFIAVEVKYTESMHEQPARLRPRYDELSRESNLFVDPDHPALRQAPIQQLWRQHLLCYAMLKNGLYAAGRFILIAPSLNHAVREAVAQYRTHLLPGGAVPFEAISFEQVIGAIRRSGAPETAEKLHDRYCNWAPIDALILD